ncbi:hypothetical protein C7974DRAFT_200064 [Boeremia exigua]|uniref:uncharacterized protein n=1 Tax=Boeremia exigua TaxID=749465 RepID=UPI001E8E2203|nr:uncharacterized protein C7974DRAFT_200064 [Boeremia exigua]KAH6625359.1 hypothetical protein C7974DRAFT_200064 [Boeremia exigua]
MAHSAPPPPDGMSTEELAEAIMVVMRDGDFVPTPSIMRLEELCSVAIANMDDETFEAAQRGVFEMEKGCVGRCACSICLAYFYDPKHQQSGQCQYRALMSAPEASKLLSDHTEDIFASQAYLRQTMQQHGEEILCYWRAADQRARATLLRSAYPEIPQSNNFDVGKSLEEIRRSANRKALLLPYLDLETLVKDQEALVGLVHHRKESHPQEWAPFDNEQLRRSWTLGLYESDFNHGAVTFQGSNYGQYTSWHADAAHRLDIVGFPRGRLVIEAQATLMLFLRHVVRELV